MNSVIASARSFFPGYSDQAEVSAQVGLLGGVGDRVGQAADFVHQAELSACLAGPDPALREVLDVGRRQLAAGRDTLVTNWS